MLTEALPKRIRYPQAGVEDAVLAGVVAHQAGCRVLQTPCSTTVLTTKVCQNRLPQN